MYSSASRFAPELYFLIADFLGRHSPCAEAASVLKREAAQHGLFGTTVELRQGKCTQRRHTTYDDVHARFPALPPDQLLRQLSRALCTGARVGSGARTAATGGAADAAPAHDATGRRLGGDGGQGGGMRGGGSLLEYVPPAPLQMSRAAQRAQLEQQAEAQIAAEQAQQAMLLQQLQPELPPPVSQTTAALLRSREAERSAAAVRALGNATRELAHRRCVQQDGEMEGRELRVLLGQLPATAGQDSEEGSSSDGTSNEPEVVVLLDDDEDAHAGRASSSTVAPAAAAAVVAAGSAASCLSDSIAAAGTMGAQLEGSRPAAATQPAEDDSRRVMALRRRLRDVERHASSRRCAVEQCSTQAASRRREVAVLTGRPSGRMAFQSLRTPRALEQRSTESCMLLRAPAMPGAFGGFSRAFARALRGVGQPGQTDARPPAWMLRRLQYAKFCQVKSLLGTTGGQPSYCCAFDCAGRFVLTGSDDQLVKLWSADRARLLITIRSHKNVITDLAVHPGNAMLATASDDRTVRLWSLQSGRPLATLLGFTDTPNRVKFDVGGRHVVVSADDGTTRVWEVPRDKRLEGVTGSSDSAAVEDELVAGSWLGNPQPVLVARHLPPAGASASSGGGTGAGGAVKVQALAMSPLGVMFATGAEDGLVRLWRLPMLASTDDSDVGAGASQHVASQLADAEEVPQDNSAGNLQQRLAAQMRRSRQASPGLFARQQAAVDSGAAESSAAFAPATEANHLIHTFRGHTSAVSEICFSHRGDRMASCSKGDGTARVWFWCWDNLPGSDSTTGVDADGDADATAEAVARQVAKAARAAVAATGGGAATPSPPPTPRRTTTRASARGPTLPRVWEVRGMVLYLDALRGVVRSGSGAGDGINLGLGSPRGAASGRVGCGRSKGPRARVRERTLAMCCDDVCWTADDSLLVTSHSVRVATHGGGATAAAAAAAAQAAKDASPRDYCCIGVWDPTSGSLLHTLRGHTAEIGTLSAHPLDADVFLSAGHDGRVLVWDARRGELLTEEIVKMWSSETVSPSALGDHLGVAPGDPVALYDGGFAPDGESAAVVDRCGRLHLLGFGEARKRAEKRPSAAPPEQFFESDWHEVVLDAQSNALDAQTQLPPHQTPTGLLVDASGAVHSDVHQPPWVRPVAGGAAGSEAAAADSADDAEMAHAPEIATLGPEAAVAIDLTEGAGRVPRALAPQPTTLASLAAARKWRAALRGELYAELKMRRGHPLAHLSMSSAVVAVKAQAAAGSAAEAAAKAAAASRARGRMASSSLASTTVNAIRRFTYRDDHPDFDVDRYMQEASDEEEAMDSDFAGRLRDEDVEESDASSSGLSSDEEPAMGFSSDELGTRSRTRATARRQNRGRRLGGRRGQSRQSGGSPDARHIRSTRGRRSGARKSYRERSSSGSEDDSDGAKAPRRHGGRRVVNSSSSENSSEDDSVARAIRAERRLEAKEEQMERECEVAKKKAKKEAAKEDKHYWVPDAFVAPSDDEGHVTPFAAPAPESETPEGDPRSDAGTAVSSHPPAAAAAAGSTALKQERICILCHRPGTADDPLPGPMIGLRKVVYQKAYTGKEARAAWVHDSCAMFCPRTAYERCSLEEVEEAAQAAVSGAGTSASHAAAAAAAVVTDGEAAPVAPAGAYRWFNLGNEIRRCRAMTCSHCGLKGASTGCWVKKCKANLHLHCAKEAGQWGRHEGEVLPVCDEHPFYCGEHRNEYEARAGRTKGKGKGRARVVQNQEQDRSRTDHEWRTKFKFRRAWLSQQSSPFVGRDRGSSQSEPPVFTQTYAPQMGDRVVYFPQGHRAALRLRPQDIEPPWQKFPQNWHMVLCKVDQLEYEFPTPEAVDSDFTSIVCRMKLRIIGIPTEGGVGASASSSAALFTPPAQSITARTRHGNNKLSNIDFEVLHMFSGIPEFLVHESKVRDALDLDTILTGAIWN
jgi:WD40 repeat protein